MSWDADLITADVDGNEHGVRDWNYTHNCNRMANAVLERFWPGYLRNAALRWWSKYPDVLLRIEADESWSGSWWQALDGMTAKESLELLDLIVGTLMETPQHFREMNPENGWGDFDSFLAVLREMRETAADHPSAVWRTSG